MKRGFTLLEVLLAAIILGLGVSGILMSLSSSQKMMLASTELQTVQEVMDLGEMAYPLSDVKDPDEGLEVRETKAVDLWETISEERLTRAQEEKYYGYTWERESLDKHTDEKDLKRLGNLYRVRVIVRWGDDLRGHHQEESYVTFWKRPES